MIRSEQRRQAKDLKKNLSKMNLSELQEFIKDTYVKGVNNTITLHKEALSEIYGFGDARYNRIYEHVVDQLVKDRKVEKESISQTNGSAEDNKEA